MTTINGYGAINNGIDEPIEKPTSLDDDLIRSGAHSAAGVASAVAATDSEPLLPFSETSTTRCYLPRRYILAALLFFGITIGYAIRVAMSVAILSIKVGTSWQDKETTQGLVLASFFVGYLVTQIPTGELARRFGPKLVYIIFYSVACISTIVLPLAGPSLPMIICMRIISGLGFGVLFTGTHVIVSNWVPLVERATVLTCIWAGIQAGTLISLATTEIICKKLGWPYVFYIWGGLGMIWVILWTLFAIDSPLSRSQGKGYSVLKISRAEANHLVKEVPALTAPETPTPWRLLLSRMATWAIVAGHFSHAWIGYVLLSFLPKFLTSLHYSPGQFGLIPYAGTAVVSVLAGKLADLTITRFNVPVIWVRRIWQTIGAGGTCLFLALIAGLVKTDKDGTLAVIFLTFAMSIGGFTSSGFGANHIDIGPKYAGPLMGITNTWATVPGIIGVFLTGFILDHTHGNYTVVWLIAIAVYTVGTTIFFIFVKGTKVFD